MATTMAAGRRRQWGHRMGPKKGLCNGCGGVLIAAATAAAAPLPPPLPTAPPHIGATTTPLCCRRRCPIVTNAAPLSSLPTLQGGRGAMGPLAQKGC